ncbi:hypothetical protein [Bythopirellula goksoeyrii]|uniref:Uncharacterized protein n=1 Tax=Bythopirellula goksoeyrii TaxID=1400387 RepID=A0A5B9Q5Q0_9BACT|nr:hypothetical protein [Bythopirellula goksoeyrii]QEG34384.1 hypothetical protein Pr1d_16600 [Bythopirellula goksoeyrii]
MPGTCGAPVGVKRAYATKLAPQLAKDYGKCRRYTPNEVFESANRAGLDIDYICWGYVLFWDQMTFEALHDRMGETCDYAEMHTEIGSVMADAAECVRSAKHIFLLSCR